MKYHLDYVTSLNLLGRLPISYCSVKFTLDRGRHSTQGLLFSPVCSLSPVDLTHFLLLPLQPHRPLPCTCPSPARTGALSSMLPQGSVGLTPSLPSGLCSNMTSSEKPALIALFKKALPFITHPSFYHVYFSS